MAKGQILVVDDNPNLLELIRMRLKSAEYDVTGTADELEAVRELKEKFFDLRIVDRGPAPAIRERGVIIDVSRAAAQRLGFITDGRTRVRVEVLQWGGGN